MQPEDREAVDHYREVLEGYQSFFGALPGVIETLAGCATYEEMEGVLTSDHIGMSPIIACAVLNLPVSSLCEEGRSTHLERVRATIAEIERR